MTVLYTIALFVHVVGALLLFITFTVEGLGLWLLRRATSAEQAREGGGIAGLTRTVGPASALAILIPGVYMTAVSWGWVAWIVTSLAGWFLIAVVGAVTGIRLAAVTRTAAQAEQPAWDAATPPLRSPLFLASWLTRVALALGIVLIMTSKPDWEGAVLILAVAAISGAGASALAWRRSSSPKRVPIAYAGSSPDA
jgi:hypothetical protein